MSFVDATAEQNTLQKSEKLLSKFQENSSLQGQVNE